jgi:hypothetical protein
LLVSEATPGAIGATASELVPKELVPPPGSLEVEVERASSALPQATSVAVSSATLATAPSDHDRAHLDARAPVSFSRLVSRVLIEGSCLTRGSDVRP